MCLKIDVPKKLNNLMTILIHRQLSQVKSTKIEISMNEIWVNDSEMNIDKTLQRKLTDEGKASCPYIYEMNPLLEWRSIGVSYRKLA